VEGVIPKSMAPLALSIPGMGNILVNSYAEV